ncbi:hypothetical protein B0J18DRAFT_130938 [Chaetomium sp. MPI-SDFR-AT-0129]|nr:hypothetical protein B0J18DRAFT_130938 [Chaetomium sp. MPI-SDFR-AT-0129]
MARRDSPPAVTLYLDQQPPLSQPAQSALPTPRFISSILTVSIGTLGTETTRSPSTGQTRQTGTPSSPSSTAAVASTSSTDGSLPVAAVVAVTVSAALLVFAGVFIMFACRRRAAKRKRASAPYEAMRGGGYHGGSEPSTPHTDSSTSPSTSSSSSLSAQALIDLGLCGSNDVRLLPLRKIPPPTSSRQSIDTATAFNFYQPERQFHRPSVTELPATPLPRLARIVPPRPSPPRRKPVPPPLQTQPTSQKQNRKQATNSGRVTTYRNPSGELWKPVSPPAAPLPALPTTPTSVTAMARRSLRVQPEGRSRDLFSLFPRPQSQPQWQTTKTQHARYSRPGRSAVVVAAASPTRATTGAETAAITQAVHPIKRNFSRPVRQPIPSSNDSVTAVGTAVGTAPSTSQTAIPRHMSIATFSPPFPFTSAGSTPSMTLSRKPVAATATATTPAPSAAPTEPGEAPRTATATEPEPQPELDPGARLSRPFLLPDRTHSLAGKKPFSGRARGLWWGVGEEGNGGV